MFIESLFGISKESNGGAQVANLVSADVVDVELNGAPLAGPDVRSVRRQLGDHVPYGGQWLELDLRAVLPKVWSQGSCFPSKTV
jgi:hypothetical protein